MSARANRCVVVLGVSFFAAGVILSRRVEPGVGVEAVTLAGDTPALQFLPANPGPRPVALLAHGVTASKETLFRFGEALAAAGVVCFAVDLPGHGESRLLSPSRRMHPPWKGSHVRSDRWTFSSAIRWELALEPRQCAAEA